MNAPSATLPQTRWPANAACDAPPCSGQVLVTLGGPQEVVVSFATHNDATPSLVTWAGADGAVRAATGSSSAYSQLMYIAPELTNPALGGLGADPAQQRRIQSDQHAPATDPASLVGPKSAAADGVVYGLGAYNNPAMYYDSPLLHAVTLAGLTGGSTYTYRVAGDARSHNFTMPADGGAHAYPLALGLVADLGQTSASEANVALLRSQRLDAVLIAGDLSYADGFGSRWDSFGRMLEPLASSVPLFTTGGNHEVGTGEAWVAYNARYRMPHKASGSPSNLWWSRDVGPVHVIALCSYAATDASSLQRRWLVRDLAAVDRARTPWLIVMTHAPWYNSNVGHRGESELMRLHIEPLLYEAAVDVVLSGDTLTPSSPSPPPSPSPSP